MNKKNAFTVNFIFTITFIFTFLSTTHSQDGNLKFNGSVNISSDFYSSSGIDPRLPKNETRAIIRLTTTVFDQIQLPFEIYLTTKQASFQQPFNQFGVSPVITDWLKLHAGYFSTEYSDLSFGDQRILGGGVELTPGNFRLSFITGRARAKRDRDTINGNPGEYQRNVWAAKLGYGNVNSFYFNLNLVQAKDDTNSIKVDSLSAAAVENLVASADFGFPISDFLEFSGEIAVAGFTNDATSNDLDSDISLPSFLINPKVSTQFDGAAIFTLKIKPSNTWSVGFNSKWIGPGFVSLGYANMPNDIFENTITPALRLFKNRLNIRTTFGIRQNNLRDTRKSTTKRTVASININSQITDNLGLDFQFNSNQFKSTHKRDSIKVDNVLSSYVLTPRYMFSAFNAHNNITFSYSKQKTEDNNPVTYLSSENNNDSYNLNYSIVFPSRLSFSTNLFHSKLSFQQISTQITNISETIGYSFFENKLSTSFTIGYNILKMEKQDKQITTRLSATYSLDKWGSLSFNISNNNYQAEDDELRPSYKELQGSIQYNLNL